MGQLAQKGVRRRLPARGHGPAVAAPDIAAHRGLQDRHPGQGTVGPHVTLPGAEPVRNDIPPGRVGGGEVKGATGVGRPPGLPLAVPMGAVVVQDPVYLWGGATPGPRAQEGQEFLMPVTRRTGIIEAAGVEVHGRSQGKGTRADIVVGAGGGIAGVPGPSRRGAFPGLPLGFLVSGPSHEVGGPFVS